VPDGQLEDAAHDVFVVAHRRDHDFDGSARPQTWLFGIVRRVAADHRRRGRRHERRLETAKRQPALREKPEDPFARREALKRVQDVLLELDDAKREVFILAHFEQMTGREVAQALQINPNTAAARLRAARREFALRFDKDDSPLEESWVTSVVRTERAPEAARRRVLAGLAPLWGIDITRSAPAPAAGGALSSKLAIAVTLVVAGVSGRAAAFGQSAPAAEAPKARAPATAITPEVPAHAPEPPRAVEPAVVHPSVDVAAVAPVAEAPEQDETPPVATRPIEQRPPRGSERDLAEQTRIARRANATDDPERVLAITGEYQRRFPDGFFGEQLGLRRIQALCRLQQHARARREVKRLRREYPRSERLPPVDTDPCREGTNPTGGGHSPR
jgi:RNA polymerase sigma-70 factor (ECF subfamily)